MVLVGLVRRQPLEAAAKQTRASPDARWPRGAEQMKGVPVSGVIETSRIAPLAVVVMGVSGSGKSTLGSLLALKLGCPFLEGDSFHSEANVAKMRDGIALTDEDRWPWLDRLGAATGGSVAEGGIAVAACSSLKRSYRERLTAATGQPIVFVLLDAAPGELERRLSARPGHYMPASLLDSQLRTLEHPAEDEPALTLESIEEPDALSERVIAWLSRRMAEVR
jgi:gluconokinase